MASPRELVEQHRDAIPRRDRVATCVLRCQSIKCPYTGAVARATCVQVASSETDPARGGVRASSEADPTRGGAYPSSEADLARVGIKASSEADLARGGAWPSSVAGLTRGSFRCAALAGRGGYRGRGRVVRVL
jgi:hypothetical protein